jgi:hypothetical protein
MVQEIRRRLRNADRGRGDSPGHSAASSWSQHCHLFVGLAEPPRRLIPLTISEKDKEKRHAACGKNL